MSSRDVGSSRITSLRVRDDRPRDADALLLALRQLDGVLGHAVTTELDHLEHFGDARATRLLVQERWTIRGSSMIFLTILRGFSESYGS